MPTLKQIGAVLALTLLCGGVAIGFSLIQEERYTATTGLSFDPSLRPNLALIGQTTTATPSDESAETNAASVGSYDVVAATAESLGLTVDAVERDVSVDVARGTQIVEISASAGSPGEAEELAETYQQEYSKMREREESQAADAARKSLENRLDGLSSSSQDEALAATLRDQITSLELISTRGTGLPVVVESVNADPDPTQPQTARNVGFGLIVGLLLGIGLVAVRRSRTYQKTEPHQLGD